MGKGLTNRIAIQSLESKGFSNTKNTDHAYYFYHNNGVQTSINTHFSFGSNEVIGDELLSRIKRQLRLNAGQAADFLKCDMDEDTYKKILISQDLI